MLIMKIVNNRCPCSEVLAKDLGKNPQDIDCQNRDHYKYATCLHQVKNKICRLLKLP